MTSTFTDDLEKANETDPAVAAVRRLLHRRFKVSMKDDRTIIGEFMCLDKQGNLILQNTYEQVTTRAGSPGSRPEERHMGCVLVPHHYRLKVELMASGSERDDLLSKFAALSQPAPVSAA